MTQEQDYATMAAGPEMDRLIGARLFGYWVYKYDKGYAPYWQLLDPELNPVALYDANTSMRDTERASEAEAWEDCPEFSGVNWWSVVEHLAARNWTLNLQWKGADREYANTAEVSLTRWDGRLPETAHAVGDTAPLAICRAALATLLYQDVQL